MKEVLDGKVASALYYMAADFLDRMEMKDKHDYMMSKFGEIKMFYLTIEQFNILCEDAYNYFKSFEKKDAK